MSCTGCSDTRLILETIGVTNSAWFTLKNHWKVHSVMWTKSPYIITARVRVAHLITQWNH